jgi:hypothetical protein
MPFGTRSWLIDRIARAVDKCAGLSCIRADDIPGTGLDLLNKVHTSIERSGAECLINRGITGAICCSRWTYCLEHSSVSGPYQAVEQSGINGLEREMGCRTLPALNRP